MRPYQIPRRWVILIVLLCSGLFAQSQTYNSLIGDPSSGVSQVGQYVQVSSGGELDAMGTLYDGSEYKGCWANLESNGVLDWARTYYFLGDRNDFADFDPVNNFMVGYLFAGGVDYVAIYEVFNGALYQGATYKNTGGLIPNDATVHGADDELVVTGYDVGSADPFLLFYADPDGGYNPQGEATAITYGVNLYSEDRIFVEGDAAGNLHLAFDEYNDEHLHVLETDDVGTPTNYVSYEDPDYELIPHDLIMTHDDGLAIVGEAVGSSATEGFLIKLNSSGTPVIYKRYSISGQANTRAFAVAETDDGGGVYGFIISGQTGSSNNHEGLIFKVGSMGGVTWAKSDDNDDDGALYDVTQTSSGYGATGTDDITGGTMKVMQSDGSGGTGTCGLTARTMSDNDLNLTTHPLTNPTTFSNSFDESESKAHVLGSLCCIIQSWEEFGQGESCDGEPCLLDPVLDWDMIGCWPGFGHVSVDDVIGGTGPYEYSLNGGPWQTDPNFSNLGIGTYNIRVRDANGCIGTYGGTILDFSGTQSPLDITVNIDWPVKPNCNWAFTVDIAGGVKKSGPNEYDITQTSGPGVPINPPGNQIQFAGTGGLPVTFVFKIVDALGCDRTVRIHIPKCFNIEEVPARYCPECIKARYAVADEVEPVVGDAVSLAVFPQPATEELTISVNGISEDRVQIGLYDLKGSRIWQTVGTLQKGTNRFLLDTDKIGSGVYLLRLEGEQHTATQKVVIE